MYRDCRQNGASRRVLFRSPRPRPRFAGARWRALVSWQVGSGDEAFAAQAVDCDLVVVRGFEAGGFIRGTIGLHAFLSEVEVPVLAAGGIGTGRAMAAALASGADGVRIGTRFAASKESGAHAEYVRALLRAQPEDTAYVEVLRPRLLLVDSAFCARAWRPLKPLKLTASVRSARWTAPVRPCPVSVHWR